MHFSEEKKPCKFNLFFPLHKLNSSKAYLYYQSYTCVFCSLLKLYLQHKYNNIDRSQNVCQEIKLVFL